MPRIEASVADIPLYAPRTEKPPVWYDTRCVPQTGLFYNCLKLQLFPIDRGNLRIAIKRKFVKQTDTLESQRQGSLMHNIPR